MADLCQLNFLPRYIRPDCALSVAGVNQDMDLPAFRWGVELQSNWRTSGFVPFRQLAAITPLITASTTAVA
jgi:hypothetical protein